MGSAAPLLVLALALSGCPRADDPPAASSDTSAAADPEAFAHKAHLDALALAEPLAAKAFALHDPVSAAALGQPVTPRLPPLVAARTQPLRDLADAAWKEVESIEPARLGATPQALARALAFGLSRIRDQLGRRRPWRSDPGWVVVEARRVLVALEDDAADGTCEHCADALPYLAADVDTAARSLGATSTPALAAAIEDLRSLADRTGRLPGAEGASTAIRAAAVHFEAVAQALPSAKAGTHAQPIAGAKTPADVLRLPARIPAKDLRRGLEVSEDQDDDPTALFTALGPTLARLQAMANARKGKAGTDTAREVDVARCDAAWAPIAAYAATQPELRPAAIECAHVQRRLSGVQLSDAALTVKLVDLGIVDRVRVARRSQEPASLALLSGRISPASQRSAVRVAILAGLRDDAALLIALAQARTAACAAATALWVHGELGTDEELGQRLAERCDARSPAAWIADAEARPMQALGGLALSRLGTGPADVVPLDRYWWAPSGLVSMLANPASVVDVPTQSRVEVNVEPLEPSDPGGGS